MPKVYLNVEVAADTFLAKIAEAKEHLSAAEDIFRDLRLWGSDTISTKENAAPEVELDATANSKSCISGIAIMLHGDADTAADSKITEQ